MGGVLSRPSGSAPGQELREFQYTPGDFERVRRLLYQQAGINLSATKDQMVYSRLARRLRSLRLRSFADYFSYLEQHEEEWQQFINALTTNLTRFFLERAGLILEGGEMFVNNGGQCVRLNLACPRAVLEEALDRLVTTILACGDR